MRAGEPVDSMKWASVNSANLRLEAAVDEAVRGIRNALGDRDPDLAVVFVSPHHQASYERIPELAGRSLGDALVIGCSAGGVIGGGREIEGHPGVAVTAAILPDVELKPFHLESAEIPAPGTASGAWEDVVGVSAGSDADFLLLPDPFSFDAETFVRALDASFPGRSKVGGLASGAREPGANALILGDRVYRSGLVGVALRGDVAIDTIVAQGCRPIGLPMFVTRCRQNLLFELDGVQPLDVLQDLFQRLPSKDRELFRHSLFLGIVMNEEKSEYRQGDFLIRNLMGADPETGALAIGALLREGSVVQFHLRDARTSAEDLEELLTRYAGETRGRTPEGALLFSCLGRGRALYGEPDHDTGAFRHHLGNVPLGGFFCNGEIGPVQGRTFLHGYTSSFGLFRRRMRLAA